MTGVETSGGRITAGAVVVAAGVWTPALLETAGLSVPVTPRKGQIVVLERSPVRFRRKLSEAGYVAAVEADDAALQIAMVVESTVAAPRCSAPAASTSASTARSTSSVAGAIARRAARFFPVLHDARALRVYAGLRPLTPDHVPIVGPFAEAPNLCVATGHEGAGIGLAPATGELVAAWHTGAPSPLPIEWFSPDRFAARRAGGLVIELTVDGEPLRAPAGQSIAAALLASGRARAAPQPVGHARAGSIAASASARSAACRSTDEVVRACVTPVAAGMRVTTGYT